MASGLEDDDLVAGLRELVGERAAAGAGADDRDHVLVVVAEAGHREPPAEWCEPAAASSSIGGSGSQSRSSKPRST